MVFYHGQKESKFYPASEIGREDGQSIVETGFGSERLGKRELEILELIAQGYLNKQIALMGDTSEQTVKNQVSSILIKLGADNRTHAVLLAKERGLLTDSSQKPIPDGCDFHCGKIGEPMIAFMNTDSGNKWTCHLSCLRKNLETQEELRESEAGDHPSEG